MQIYLNLFHQYFNIYNIFNYIYNYIFLFYKRIFNYIFTQKIKELVRMIIFFVGIFNVIFILIHLIFVLQIKGILFFLFKVVYKILQNLNLNELCLIQNFLMFKNLFQLYQNLIILWIYFIYLLLSLWIQILPRHKIHQIKQNLHRFLNIYINIILYNNLIKK